jgi:hypothetical protein
MTPGPGRSLAAADFLPPERDGDIRVLLTCDCGLGTVLTIQVCGSGTTGEGAFTCDGCSTAHWFTVTAKAER